MSSISGTGWTVAAVSIGMSHLSTQYVLIPVAVTNDGEPYDPTSDTVQFAFMNSPTKVPTTDDWVAGEWETNSSNIIYPYTAKCLIGPTGTVILGIGNYVMYLKVIDNPEIPVLISGYLQIS